MANKPLYIQLEPGAYPKDIDWQSMTPSDRGCYHSLIIYLACSDGTLPNDTEKLAILCNINAQEFEKFWKSFSHKFIEKDGEIEHRRVSDELKKARNYLKQKSLAGKKGMQRRYNTDITTLQQTPNNDITKEREVKGSKVKLKESKEEKNIPHVEFLEYWNKTRLPKIQVFTGYRRKQLNVRSSEPVFLTRWVEIIDKLVASDFCNGINDQKWRAKVDWILKNDTNYMKVLEGNYDNKPKDKTPLEKLAEFEEQERKRKGAV